jgi:ribonuclease HII
VTFAFRIGADENGLGARLGPMIVTAVLARVDERGTRTLSRKLPRAIRADLDDSKRLMTHTDVALGEAWARVLTDERAASPAALFEQLSLEGSAELQKPCPKRTHGQCWTESRDDPFQADAELLARIRGHRAALAERGIELIAVRTSAICTGQLNTFKARGKNRFVADLHAMEALILALRARAGSDVQAVCGKVGGMGEYSKFFGPLSGRLHAIIEQGQPRSAYRFPGIGEVHFVRDADASDKLVSLASIVGKYVRELFMSRIGRHYPSDGPRPSGYHDPVTERFVAESALVRDARGISASCFEREPVARAAELLAEA